MPPTRGPVIKGDVIRPKNLQLQPHWTRGMRPREEMCLKSRRKDYRCQSELELLTPADVQRLGLPAGTKAALHKCVRPKSMEGQFVPVQTPEQALREANRFCKCVGDSVESTHRKKCARR